MAIQHYFGGCQCGAVRFEVDLDLDDTMTCNCSRCGRLGTILTFAPAGAFTLKKGEGAMTEYLFNKHRIQHLFCATCGVESFARGTKLDGTAVVAVNARTLDGVDLSSLKPIANDGAST
ncbi:GFA family protein [Aquabacter sp. CN5-332]|uniref:GFA family protein n=1 Tax=Aquabacter sp. CN5-332 TaxID=3156608 RepID=UPI0032B616E0